MTAENLVTVIIPTFNRQNTLSDAIESVLNQTYKNLQIIIIDDGSNDGTVELLKNYPQVEYHYKKNGGQASARNHGLQHAKGSIIASLDSDDIWYPDFLTRCVEKLESEQLDFVFANWDQERKNGDCWSFLANDPFLKPYFKDTVNNWVNLKYVDSRSLYLKACPSPSSSAVIRKSSIVGGWDEEMKIGDDWDMYLHIILSKECKVSFTMEKLWRKRIDNINIYDGRKWSEILKFLYIDDLRIEMEKFKGLLTKEELDILEKRYTASLVELSKHHLIREFNLLNSLNLLGIALKVSIPFTLKAIPDIIIKSLKGKINYQERTQLEYS